MKHGNVNEVYNSWSFCHEGWKLKAEEKWIYLNILLYSARLISFIIQMAGIITIYTGLFKTNYTIRYFIKILCKRKILNKTENTLAWKATNDCSENPVDLNSHDKLFINFNYVYVLRKFDIPIFQKIDLIKYQIGLDFRLYNISCI